MLGASNTTNQGITMMTQAEFNLYVQTNSIRRASRTGQSFTWSGRGFPLTTRGAMALCSLVLFLGVAGSLVAVQNLRFGLPTGNDVVMVAHEAHLEALRPHA
jgi:hypothetical protein